MNVQIYRYNPEKDGQGKLVEYTIKEKLGMSILALLHHIHDDFDGTFSYRYCCRGAICGTCAVTINGKARLACKTQVSDLMKEEGKIIIEPLSNFGLIKDLVVDHRVFWDKIKNTMPWINRKENRANEKWNYEVDLDKHHLDQLYSSADCIKCASCYADCPKVTEMPEFIGPAAAVQAYKHIFDSRDIKTAERIEFCMRENGVTACDKHANCVKVCPKDCKPLRAITFIQKKIS